MKGIILAAGRGKRMGNLTEKMPKCFLRVLGKTLIDWQIEALRGAGLLEIGIVRGYMGDMFNNIEATFFENTKWKQSNILRSLLFASEWLRRWPCIVSYSDIIYTAEAVRRLLQQKGRIILAYDPNWYNLWNLRFSDVFSDAETFQYNGNGILEDIGRKTHNIEEIKGQYMGLIKFTPDGWNEVESYLSNLSDEEIDRMDMTTLFRGMIDVGCIINTAPIESFWFEVDSPSDLELCNKILGSKLRS